MKLALVIGTAFTLGALATTAAVAQGLPGDTSHGHELARKLCSNCHLVGPGEPTPARPDTPPFAAIANHAGQTPERLAGAIIIPHPEMPMVPLTIKEIRDIVAYIMSLKQ